MTAPFKVGDRVKNPNLGEGTVTKLTKSWVTVQFDHVDHLVESKPWRITPLNAQPEREKVGEYWVIRQGLDRGKGAYLRYYDRNDPGLAPLRWVPSLTSPGVRTYACKQRGLIPIFGPSRIVHVTRYRKAKKDKREPLYYVVRNCLNEHLTILSSQRDLKLCWQRRGGNRYRVMNAEHFDTLKKNHPHTFDGQVAELEPVYRKAEPKLDADAVRKEERERIATILDAKGFLTAGDWVRRGCKP